MAQIPLLQASHISLGYGKQMIFSDLSLVVAQGERIALVGRNGSGKSTLLKVMAGLVSADDGERIVSPQTTVGYMEQDPDLSGFETLGDFATSSLNDYDSYKVDMAAEGLKFDPDRLVSTASGGERRRAALAKLMAESPDLMLLDEPTNHLDIDAILWLEQTLARTSAAFVLISHDRQFLNALTQNVLWVDRGEVRKLPKGFAHFEAWRDKLWHEEDEQRHKLNRKIKAEARWAVEGISARRKRNQGRVRALQDLRSQRAAQIQRQGVAAMGFDQGATASGRKVIEAVGIEKSFGERCVLSPFDLMVQRQDRIAFVGPNGAGKTTLIKMLLGQELVDSGHVTLGTNLKPVVFDQNREQLDGDMSLWDNLTSDPETGLQGRSDQIMVRGQPKHVVGYLKEFLFDEEQARAPVRSLSGGEKARLLLAKLMARESNLLVLDEPTNDLDIETLDLLQDLLSDYPGTVLLVSHDRDFIDRVATSTVMLDGDGGAVLYAGGWQDAISQKTAALKDASTSKDGAPAKTTEAKRKAEKGAAQNQTETFETVPEPEGRNTTLSFTQKHRLQELPEVMELLSREIEKLENLLADPDLFHKQPVKFQKASEALTERQNKLSACEDEWLELEELNQ